MSNGSNGTDRPNRAPTIVAIPLALALAAAGLQLVGGGSDAGAPLEVAPVETRTAEDVLATDFTPAERALIGEHVHLGLPSLDHLHVRQGYVMSYLEGGRVPRWVAYHVVPSYLETPKRTGRFSSFRADPDLDDPVVDSDYTGLFDTRGFARGHLAPYAVMGGDRNRDGALAEADDFDAETIFQANYMSNVAPQHHDAFNGSGGLWFKLERRIQDVWVEQQGHQVWVFAGCVIGPGAHEAVGSDNDILVPPMFFKIVVREPDRQDDPDELHDLPFVLAFLFPHQRQAHGEIEDYLVTVDVIEALTGLDFFNELSDPVEAKLEDTDTVVNWEAFAGPV